MQTFFPLYAISKSNDKINYSIVLVVKSAVFYSWSFTVLNLTVKNINVQSHFTGILSSSVNQTMVSVQHGWKSTETSRPLHCHTIAVFVIIQPGLLPSLATNAGVSRIRPYVKLWVSVCECVLFYLSVSVPHAGSLHMRRKTEKKRRKKVCLSFHSAVSNSKLTHFISQ